MGGIFCPSASFKAPSYLGSPLLQWESAFLECWGKAIEKLLTYIGERRNLKRKIPLWLRATVVLAGSSWVLTYYVNVNAHSTWSWQWHVVSVLAYALAGATLRASLLNGALVGFLTTLLMGGWGTLLPDSIGEQGLKRPLLFVVVSLGVNFLPQLAALLKKGCGLDENWTQT